MSEEYTQRLEREKKSEKEKKTNFRRIHESIYWALCNFHGPNIEVMLSREQWKLILEEFFGAGAPLPEEDESEDDEEEEGEDDAEEGEDVEKGDGEKEKQIPSEEATSTTTMKE